jgi:hypothetical protein
MTRKMRTVTCPADGQQHQVTEKSARAMERKYNVKITQVYHTAKKT